MGQPILTNSGNMRRWFCVALAMAAGGCAEPSSVAAPDSWWEGPGANLGASTLTGDAGDGSPPMFRPHTLLAFEDDRRLRLDHFASWRASAEVETFGEADPGAHIVGTGTVLAVLTSGSASSITAGPFDPERASETQQLPPNSGPTAFLQTAACSLIVLAGAGQVLIVEDHAPPTFLDLPGVTSAAVVDERLFVGAREEVLELSCSGDVLSRRDVEEPLTLLGATTQGTAAYVVLDSGDVHRLDPDGESALGVLSATEAETAAVASTGEFWFVSGSTLRCVGDESADVAVVDGEALAMAIDGRGGLSLVDAADAVTLRIMETEGCHVEEERRVDLDAPPVDLAVVVRVVTGNN